jgi:hypothetical protein
MGASGPEGHRAASNKRPILEVADIVREHGEEYARRYPVTPEQRKVLRAIAACRTAALGGHVDVCDACGDVDVSYNSCRDRHCPKCQGQSQARWMAQRKARILPTAYFHVVFTLPAGLRALAMCNRARIYDLIFASASEALLALGRDPRRLGAHIGVTAVLHTWSRDLSFHPHLHCIVTGGGLSLDGARWVAGSARYLFPVRVLGALFRGKLLAGLTRAYARGELTLAGRAAALSDPAAFASLRDQLYRTAWVVYAKPPFGGAEHVYEYLGRYTHRVGLSNHRLLGMDERGVCMRTRGNKTVTLTGTEFLRRFLQHVLPRGFVKIRHYGLMASTHATTTLETARARLEAGQPTAPVPAAEQRATSTMPADDATPAGSSTDVGPCPRCGQGLRTRHPLAWLEAATPSPARLDSS